MRKSILLALFLSVTVVAEPLNIEMPWENSDVDMTFLRYPTYIAIHDHEGKLILDGTPIEFEMSNPDLAPGSYVAKIQTRMTDPELIEEIPFTVRKDHQTNLYTKYFRNYGPGETSDEGKVFEEDVTYLRWSSKEGSKFEATTNEGYQLVKVATRSKIVSGIQEVTLVTSSNPIECADIFNHHIVAIPGEERSVHVNGIPASLVIEENSNIKRLNLGVITINTSHNYGYKIRHLGTGKYVVSTSKSCMSLGTDSVSAELKGSKTFKLPVGKYEISIAGKKEVLKVKKDVGIIYYY